MQVMQDKIPERARALDTLPTLAVMLCSHLQPHDPDFSECTGVSPVRPRDIRRSVYNWRNTNLSGRSDLRDPPKEQQQ